MAVNTAGPGVATRARRFMRMGLRTRLTVAFALGALVLSVILATVTYGLVRENLVRQREASATRQAFLNARVLRDSLRGASASEQSLLDTLQTPAGASPVLFRAGQWFAANPIEQGREQLPVRLRELVASGKAARMRFNLKGTTELAIGVPIPSIDGAYFEIASFSDVQRTLTSLALSLLAAAIVTTIAGAALGATASRRVLRPLSHVSAAAVAIAGGRLDTRVARVTDPELGTLIDSFNDMAGALQERIERDARFASDVSHELRSPLTTLTASVGILDARRDELPERARAALDLLSADVQRFSSMVEDLLEISRFDAGAAHLHLETARISELVVQAVAASGNRGVPITVSAEAAASTVAVDKRRLVAVVSNLLSNAERHGGGATTVDVELGDGGTVRIAVEDAGAGVAPEDKERVFERFARGADAAGRRGTGEGVGLGLALVREHVNLHGGRTWVEDRRDGAPGARFVLELPLVAVGPDSAGDEVDLGPAAISATELATELAAEAAAEQAELGETLE
ncbi:MAG: HAMP domain-containing histidine kinase [Acidobacteria bacterium]|nr:HAMP domain-containing histidine kinase [Acidobacteriota bacterium]